jgi:uncharacterized protein YciI
MAERKDVCSLEAVRRTQVLPFGLPGPLFRTRFNPTERAVRRFPVQHFRIFGFQGPIPMKALLTILLLAVLSAPLVRAEEPAAATPPKKQTFVYMLRLVPRLHDEKAWTKEDSAIVGRHFQRLKDATAAGTVVFAGRTMESGDKTFGLVVFEAANADEAKVFADADPAVTDGVMTVTVHPFALVLQRK